MKLVLGVFIILLYIAAIVYVSLRAEKAYKNDDIKNFILWMSILILLVIR